MNSTPRPECGSFGCRMPPGHNMGQVDIPENHNPHARPEWDSYFLGVAVAVAQRGDCTRSRVGAVLVDDQSKRILSTGFNGVDRGQPGCLSGACPRGLLTLDEHPPGGDYSNCIAKHAEHNTLEWWDVFNRTYTVRQHSATSMYITRRPCDDCQQLMKEYGITRTLFPDGYLDLTPNKGL